MSGRRYLYPPDADQMTARQAVQDAARDLLEAVRREVAIHNPHALDGGYPGALALQALLEVMPPEQGARCSALVQATAKFVAAEAGGQRGPAAVLFGRLVAAGDRMVQLALQLHPSIHPSAKEAN